jgi:hypothetical protein
MIDDPIDYANTMRTLGYGVVVAAGFQDDAYAAATGLIRWNTLWTPARQAWMKATLAERMRDQLGRTRRGGFFRFLSQLRAEVFGPTDNTDTAYQLPWPWALSDDDFAYAMLYIRTDREPDPAKFTKPNLSKAAQTAIDVAEKMLAKRIIKYIAAGIAAGLVFKKVGPIGVGLTVGATFMQDRMQDIVCRGYVERYKIDEIRRIHLATKGLSTYQAIAVSSR